MPPSTTPSAPEERPAPRDAFQWPPPDDELAVYEVPAGHWQAPQPSAPVTVSASADVLPPRPNVAGRSTGRWRGAVVAAAIVVLTAGWILHRLATESRPAAAPPVANVAASPTVADSSVHTPSADPVVTPPRLTITATYPVAAPVTSAAPVPNAARVDSAPRPADGGAASGSVFEAPAPAIEARARAAAAWVPAAGPVAPATVAAMGTAAAVPVAPTALARDPRTLINGVLLRYADAYDRRDVNAAAVLWPTLDRRALTRAFASLTRQDVDFERCTVDVAEARGAATCVGTVRYVPTIGRGVEKEGRITWTFDLVRAGEQWQIAGLRAR